MKTTTTKYTTPLYVKDGSPEADFVQRFEGCMTSVWVFLDDNGLFFEHPQLKADWQEMEQYWDKRPFLRSPPRRRAHLSCRVLYRVFR